MIKVCDAIMGSGKSSAAITLMNENPDRKFIYITPYLDEATRIKEACSGMHIIEPDNKPWHRNSKTVHTIDLVKQNRNVATTHQAFKYYPPELLDLIREKQYTLIIDESLSIFDKVDSSPVDLNMFIDGGFASADEFGNIQLTDKPYTGVVFNKLASLLKTRNLLRITYKNGTEQLFYWQLPKELFTASHETYILTYLFNGQGLSQLLQLYGLPYEMIGVYRDACGTYRFTDSPFPMPEYVSDLPNKIHILDNEKMNAIGDDRYALSMHWFERERNKLLEGDDDNQIEPLRRHLGYFFNKMSDAQSTDRMWGVFAADEDTVKGPGYTKKFVQWNERSKNCYMNRRALAYCPNIFMNVGHKDYFRRLGIPVDEDAYALSIMIQWIWRSAIRCGEDIDIYVPSSRMRKLLTDWIKSVSGGDALAS